MRLNSSRYFSNLLSRERSNPPPPNFAPPFCALCLIVYDFLPKTWDLGRKMPPQSRCARQIPPFVAARHLPPAGGSRPSRGRLNPLSHRCAMPAPPKGELNSLSQSLTALTAPSGREPLAKPETLRHSLKPSPWGRWLDAKRQDGRGSFPGSGLALSVIADAMPPLPKGEALAKPHTLQFNRKLSLYAKGSPFGRAGKAVRL